MEAGQERLKRIFATAKEAGHALEKNEGGQVRLLPGDWSPSNQLCPCWQVRCKRCKSRMFVCQHVNEGEVMGGCYQ